MNELLEGIKAQLIAMVRATPGIDKVTKVLLDSILEGHSVWTEGGRKLTAEERAVLKSELETYYKADLGYGDDLVRLERGVVVADPDPTIHVAWEPDAANRFYWRKHKEFLRSVLALRNGPEEGARIINSIDFETDGILRNMENPLRQVFDSRGLVVGFVQSGKTANFTALISKAADAGYRFFIVLAGIHDELRQQTQIRIDRELTGYNNLDLEGRFVEWNDYESPRRWRALTSAGYLDGREAGEFSGRGINKFQDEFLGSEKPVIAIVKKNVRILDRLYNWISNSKEGERAGVPVLIIDDEADQASVDGTRNPSEGSDPTKTNESIRRIIGLFPRSSYVGYTATPFANVFIGHDSEHEELGANLYPRNFIYSLPEPRGYFGTRRIFLEDLDRLYVREIADPSGERKKLGARGMITEGLAGAVHHFIIGMAVRSLRGQGGTPMSMMINVDHRVEKMNRVGDAVSEYLGVLRRNLVPDELRRSHDAFIDGAREIDRSLGTGNDFFDREDVIREVIRIIDSGMIKVRVLNTRNEDRLDYAREPSMKVIAVGGNKLSRGLTLEGLMTTYYLRESKQFDTLLQMGRWFGYRKGYEDLVRIFTSGTLWRQFRDLAIVEIEFRENVKEMVEEGKTPRDFAIGVRQIMGLLPTAKMGAARLEMHYGGGQVSVLRLLLEHPGLLDANFEAVRRLVVSIRGSGISFLKKGGSDLPTLLARDVPSGPLLAFIEEFHVAVDTDGSPLDFDKENLVGYVSGRIARGGFQKWNVALVSIGPNEDDNEISLPLDLKVRAVNRARLKTSPVNGAYNIKAVSSRGDRMMDLKEGAVNEYDGRVNPLLLLYFISRNSRPMFIRENSSREELYKGLPDEIRRDPVSYSIIFPPDSEAKGVYKQKI